MLQAGTLMQGMGHAAPSLMVESDFCDFQAFGVHTGACIVGGSPLCACATNL